MTEAPYALGIRSLDQEVQVASLPVQGTLPPWLRGTLIRNGPARFEVGGRSYNHWFDGLAMLHAFTVEDGTVSYANRFLESRSRREAVESGRIRRSEFATDPCVSLFGRVMATFRPPVTDNANINVIRLGGGFAALTETPLPIRFDPGTLETLGVVDFQDDLKGVLTTAHPQVDPVSGVLYNYLTAFGLSSTYHLYRLDPGSLTRELVASLEVDRPAYMHSFAMTERHLVLAEFPLVVNPVELLFSGKPFIRNYRWEPQRGTRFQLFDRDTGRHLGCCTGPPLFAFHHINAFVEEVEGREEVVLDLAGYEDPAIIDTLFLERLREGSGELITARPWRFRLDPGQGTATREVLATGSVELPRINEGRTGRSYRYVWGVGNRVPGHFTDQLVKLDVGTGEALTWYVEGCFPGEPVFVPRPPEAGAASPADMDPGGEEGEPAEDDGILLSVVLDARQESSFLLVLDAATLKELARAEAPHAMPLGFHGMFQAAPVE
jgi:beta,beta-carotene 9',10'-dioxygenase